MYVLYILYCIVILYEYNCLYDPDMRSIEAKCNKGIA